MRTVYIKMPVLPTFCFCTKLDTGGYIIGTFGLIYGIYFIFSSFQGTVVILDESQAGPKDELSISKFIEQFS